jgi:hypothetical protein
MQLLFHRSRFGYLYFLSSVSGDPMQRSYLSSFLSSLSLLLLLWLPVLGLYSCHLLSSFNCAFDIS